MRKTIQLWTFIFLAVFIHGPIYPIYKIHQLNREDAVYSDFIQTVADMKLKYNLGRHYQVNELNGDSSFPKLKIAQYEIQTGDTLYNICSRMFLTLDTLISFNALSNEKDIEPGKKIFIPNMRGIFYKAEKQIKLKEIGQFYWVHPLIIQKVNNLTRDYLDKGEEIFIPGGFLTTEEWSFFNSNAFVMPLDGRLSSNYGYRTDPFTHKRTFHGGVDISAPLGSAVRATQAGKVIFAGWKGGYGNLVVIEHKYGYLSYYGHLNTILVTLNQAVESKELIGQVGSTGMSTGPHLHFEIRRHGNTVDPFSMVNDSVHLSE